MSLRRKTRHAGLSVWKRIQMLSAADQFALPWTILLGLVSVQGNVLEAKVAETYLKARFPPYAERPARQCMFYILC